MCLLRIDSGVSRAKGIWILTSENSVTGIKSTCMGKTKIALVFVTLVIAVGLSGTFVALAFVFYPLSAI